MYILTIDSYSRDLISIHLQHSKHEDSEQPRDHNSYANLKYPIYTEIFSIIIDRAELVHLIRSDQ
jgi:hypothetical protein